MYKVEFIKLRMFISVSPLSLHVRLPSGLLTLLRYSSKAFLAGVSGCSLIICPNHVNRLIFICLVQGSHFVLVYSSWLVMFLCHLIPRIFRMCLRGKVSMLFSKKLVIIDLELIVHLSKKL